MFTETQHIASIEDFKISKFTLTQGEYITIIGNNPSVSIGNNKPVENITWYDACMFCNELSIEESLTPYYNITGIVYTGNNITFAIVTIPDLDGLGYRLPTETEWEFSCRGEYEDRPIEYNTMPFGIGDKESIDDTLANFNTFYPYDIIQGEHYDSSASPIGDTIQVESYEENDYKLFQMHGNVFEWCWDWADTYPGDGELNHQGASTGVYKIKRGGGYNSRGKHLRAAYRGFEEPHIISNDTGFRLAQNVPRVPTPESNFPYDGEVEYDDPLEIILTCSASESIIWYTLDGSQPVPMEVDEFDNPTGSYEYTDPIPLTVPMILKAIASREEWKQSFTATWNYTSISSPGMLAMPTITPNGGLVLVGTEIVMTTNSVGADIYYEMTTNGSVPPDPTDMSTLYTGPIIVPYTAVINIKAISWRP